MTAVSNVLAADAAILASALNTNFSDVVSLATAVGNEQISGGLTYDKLADRNGPSWMSIPLVPFSFSAAWAAGSVVNYSIPVVEVAIMNFVPVLKAGVEAYLVGATLNAVHVAVSGASYPRVSLYLNGTVKIAQMDVTAAGATFAAVAIQNDPIANPLCSMSDGDFLEIRLGPNTGAGAAEVRGLTLSLAFKNQLVA